MSIASTMNLEVSNTVRGQYFEKPILIADYDEFICRSCRKNLLRNGFKKVAIITRPDEASEYIDTNPISVIFLDVLLGGTQSPNISLDLLRHYNTVQKYGVAIMLCTDPTTEILRCCASAGAEFFMYKGRLGNISNTLLNVMSFLDKNSIEKKGVTFMKEYVFLSSLGLTDAEIEILSRYAEGYPKIGDLARLLEIKEANLRKTFSRVYKKIGSHVDVNNSAQLSHLLTICSLF